MAGNNKGLIEEWVTDGGSYLTADLSGYSPEGASLIARLLDMAMDIYRRLLEAEEAGLQIGDCKSLVGSVFKAYNKAVEDGKSEAVIVTDLHLNIEAANSFILRSILAQISGLANPPKGVN